MKSETINELATALCKAQGQMNAAQKGGDNPHLGSRYTTFDDVIEAIRQPLSNNGLSFTQVLSQGKDGLMLVTMLMHESGQFISGKILVPSMSPNRGINEIQTLGSALTYMKRYALTSILGVSSEDDDGHSARRTQSKADKQPVKSSPKKAQNGNDHKSPPKKFFDEVQVLTSNYYKNETHLYNTIGGQWPDFGNTEAVNAAKSNAVDHAITEKEAA